MCHIQGREDVRGANHRGKVRQRVQSERWGTHESVREAHIQDGAELRRALLWNDAQRVDAMGGIGTSEMAFSTEGIGDEFVDETGV